MAKLPRSVYHGIHSHGTTTATHVRTPTRTRTHLIVYSTRSPIRSAEKIPGCRQSDRPRRFRACNNRAHLCITCLPNHLPRVSEVSTKLTNHTTGLLNLLNLLI